VRRRTLLTGLCVGAWGVESSAWPRAIQGIPVIGSGGQLDLRIGFARPGGGYTIQTLPLETYIARVLAGEAARDSPAAALDVLAITSRTFALGNRDRHRADGFDLCDETHCQVVRTATAATTRAAEATAGQALTRNGAIASVYYSASCGGRTEIPSNVWPGADDPPYLPSSADDACGGAPAWEAELDAADLLRAFRAAGFRGDRFREMRIASRNSSGRVARLSLDGLTPPEISGQDLRVVVGRTLGWQHIKSTAFELRRQGAAGNPGVIYRFSGHGFGHGVGLCVIGATNLAARGVDAPAILAKYFPGADITTPLEESSRPAPAATALPGVLVSLPDDDEGERATIAKLTIQARDELAKTLGVPTPANITLRFHPTTDDYERATGQSWFTSGAWVKNGVKAELHLLPLAVLRDRGVLERTIRHELVHAMADDILGKRPAWVREGAAIYFAGERPIPGQTPAGAAARPEPRAACPDDSELLRPVSVGALSNAYARARSCFARQIADGKSWRDIR
jgi:stage II sporulation protein D (peptidoglycan lytic transglycosylase)